MTIANTKPCRILNDFRQREEKGGVRLLVPHLETPKLYCHSFPQILHASINKERLHWKYRVLSAEYSAWHRCVTVHLSGLSFINKLHVSHIIERWFTFVARDVCGCVRKTALCCLAVRPLSDYSDYLRVFNLSCRFISHKCQIQKQQQSK